MDRYAIGARSSSPATMSHSVPCGQPQIGGVAAESAAPATGKKPGHGDPFGCDRRILDHDEINGVRHGDAPL
jgi:hypothetical protein